MSEYAGYPGQTYDSMKKNPIYREIPCLCFKPGHYQLKVAYFPFLDRNDILKHIKKNENQQRVEKIISFEVTAYEKEEDIKAYNWLKSLEIPNFIFFVDPNPYYFHTSVFDPTYEVLLEEFLIKFPDSSFAPYAAFRAHFFPTKLNKADDFSEEEKKQGLQKTLNRLEFIKERTDNQFLLNYGDVQLLNMYKCH